MTDPVMLEQARERLVFRETGKRPVNDKTRSRARVDFKRAEMMFRQRRYEDAQKAASRAHTGDPDRWEYRFLYLRSAWRSGDMQTEAVVSEIMGLEGVGRQERGEALYICGEMLLQDGQDKRAYNLFRQAVESDPENVGARRRIRLRESRDVAGQSKKGTKGAAGGKNKGARPLFGGLFGRRGD
jgi:tetratricopeptide (TPR) repeat protein